MSNQPDVIEVSAYDRDYGQLDNEINIHGGWKSKDYNKLLMNSVTMNMKKTAQVKNYIL